MKTINNETTTDPFIHKIKERKESTSIRFLNAAIPLLLMGKTTGKPISFILSGYQIGSHLYQLKKGGGRKSLLNLTHACAYTGLTTLSPTIAPLYSTLIQVVLEPKSKERLFNQALFLAPLYINRPEILAASFLTQAIFELKAGYQEYRKERYIEAAGKLALGLIRGYAGIHQIQVAYKLHGRNQLWQKVKPLKTGLTRKELDTLMDYVEKAPQVEMPTRIKGSLHHLPRSVTLTKEEGLYIHLKKKGGLEPLGGGAFKTAYKALKIGKEVKLMAELTVHRDLDLALQEDRLAKEIASPHINGGAEVVVRYADKLSLIQNLMDIDGFQYIQNKNGSAKERLHVMAGVAKGVGDLHKAGWAHGDIHPGNMLVKLGGLAEGKLSDLGLAYPLPTGNNDLKKVELYKLSCLIGAACGPVWKQFPEDSELKELQEVMERIPKSQAADLISAYDLANKLEAVSRNLGEKGKIPLYSKSSWAPQWTTLPSHGLPEEKGILSILGELICLINGRDLKL